MSSTTTTQYYGLSQYIGTDKPDWTDNNEAFREVDADLHEAVQSMEGFGTDIAALQEAQSALTTEVTGLEADLNTEKAKITALQNKETLQDAEIAGVKADALDMITAVDEGTAQVATVAVNEGKYFRYNDVLYIATTNIAVGDTIVPNTNCRATNVGTELEAQAEDIAEVKSDLNDKADKSDVNDLFVYIGISINVGILQGLEAKWNQTTPITNVPSGYTVFGISGYALSGTNFTSCTIPQLGVSGNNLTWTVANVMSNATGALTLGATVICRKTL